MKIALRKISDERHALDVTRDDHTREHAECESRSLLVHDLLHFAIESEARLTGGFWGNLARGTTLADLKAIGMTMADAVPEMAMIERIVGALTGAVKGESASHLVTALRGHAETLDWPMPEWLTEDFVVAVQERMRQLLGRWRATPYGGSMELDWWV